MSLSGRLAVSSRVDPAGRALVVLLLILSGLLALIVGTGLLGGDLPGEATARPADHAALADGYAQLDLPGPPRRVIPASAGAVDLVCNLLGPDRVAALPAQALRYSGLRDENSAHLALPTFAVYESERILAFDPDLVLAHSWQSADTTERLRAAGVPVFILPDANTWPAIVEQLAVVARLLHAEPAGRRLLEDCERRLADLAHSIEGRPRPTALCYSNGGAGGWVAGADTTNDEALRLAGLRNVAAEAGRRGHTSISYEELLLLDPDLIVVGGRADAQQPGGTAELLLNAAPLAGLRAVAQGRILVLDSWLYTTTSQYLVDEALEIARLAAPYRDAAR